MALNPDQQRARDTILKRIEAREPVTEMTGPAGSGKSYLVANIIETLGLEPFDLEKGTGGYIVCTPTNKSAAILRRRGIRSATTAHKVTSRPMQAADSRIHELLESLSYEEVADPSSAKAKQIRQELQSALAVKFDDNYMDQLRSAKLIIVDEGGMIPTTIANRLLSVGVPLLVAGDPYQLDPVGESPLFLTGKPHVHLEMIERQAENSAILELADKARKGEAIAPGKYSDKVVVRENRPPAAVYQRADAVIVGTHRTRRHINNTVRALLGYERDTPPQPGEKYVSTRTVNAGFPRPVISASDFVQIDQIIQDGEDFKAKITSNDLDALVNRMASYRMWGGPFADHAAVVPDRKLEELKGLGFAQRQRRLLDHSTMAEIDYAYAVTCHRMQGDEADKVVVVNDGWGRTPEQRRRWLYTALTRAKDALYLSLS